MSKTLFIDADDTLYQTMEVFCTQYSALSKQKLEVKDLISWSLYDIVDHPFYVDVILKNPNFFENLPLKGNGIPEIVSELNNYYDLYILTSSNMEAIPGKVKAFLRDFPFLKQNQIIFCWDKFLVKGDYIIDDALHNIQGFKNTNKQGRSFCVNMPHNKSINDGVDYRIDTLEEIGVYLL